MKPPHDTKRTISAVSTATSFFFATGDCRAVYAIIFWQITQQKQARVLSHNPCAAQTLCPGTANAVTLICWRDAIGNTACSTSMNVTSPLLSRSIAENMASMRSCSHCVTKDNSSDGRMSKPGDQANRPH